MKKFIVPVIAISFFGFFIIILTGYGIYWNQFIKTPEQPIKFSHKIHAYKANIACVECHLYTEKSISAGIPSVSKCISCHITVTNNSSELAKLHSYYDEKKPIEWYRVYFLPQHVYFSHKRHIKTGLNCTECHGDKVPSPPTAKK